MTRSSCRRSSLALRRKTCVCPESASIVSLRGRRLLVMIGSFDSNRRMRTSAPPGSYVPGTASSKSRAASREGDAYRKWSLRNAGS